MNLGELLFRKALLSDLSTLQEIRKAHNEHGNSTSKKKADKYICTIHIRNLSAFNEFVKPDVLDNRILR